MGENSLFAAQGGLVSRRQALDAGVSSTTIARRLADKEWWKVFPGVYRHAAATVSDSLMVNATVLWLGSAAALHGWWAGWWHDLLGEPDGPVSVTVPLAASYRVHPFVAIRRRDLAPCDVITLRGVRVTTRALTALECAGLPGGRDAFDRALQQHTRVPEFAPPLERLAHATGVRAARAAVGDARDGTVSRPERELASALRRAGITALTAGVSVVASGRRCWLDFAVVEKMVAVEVDGYGPHSDPEVFRSDRERQNALILAGWTVLRFTPWQIRNELDSVLRQIRRGLGEVL